MPALELASSHTALSHGSDDLFDHPLWAGCERSTIELLLQGSVRGGFCAGDEITREGDPAEFLHVVLSGSVALFARYRNHQTEFGLIKPPHAFIVAAVLANQSQLVSARALQQSEVLMAPAASVRAAFARDEYFARRMTAELAQAYRTVTREIKSQTLLTAVERLAKWLLERDDETGGHRRFDIPFEKRALAARLGMAPEVLSRALSALAKSAVSIRGATIEIRDREALDRLLRPKAPLGDPRRQC